MSCSQQADEPQQRNERESEPGPSSLREVATRILGEEDEAAVEQWVRYWQDSPTRNRRILADFDKLVPVSLRGRRVLDIGSGTGGLGSEVSQRGGRYLGAEFTRHVLQFSPRLEGCHFIQADATSLPFPTASFDYVFAFDVIEHLTGGGPWQLRMLQEIRRVLRPLGMAFLTTPNFWYPYDAHTRLYFPQYLPPWLRDRYIRWLNPSFIREHGTFANIRLLTPSFFRKILQEAGLSPLHSLPCGMDRRQYLRHHSPLAGLLMLAGLGWHIHAEFWVILVHTAMRPQLQLKLRRNWLYEMRQGSQPDPEDFSGDIDFASGPFSHQLGPGWHWYERDKRPFRWTSIHATCYLEARRPVRSMELHGYSPQPNEFEVQIDGCTAARQSVGADTYINDCFPIPAAPVQDRILKVEIRCKKAHIPRNPADQRELGLMIFRARLVA